MTSIICFNRDNEINQKIVYSATVIQMFNYRQHTAINQEPFLHFTTNC